ncbi:MAG TPA: maltose alpha-D-glucosyltransferase [Steroidobacteraceae bacterium]|nr:maltose alpha-D-glucosyltransferase [Steroidobacteraceae bacterium]
MNEEQASTETTADPLWYKDAVIYQLHVKAFYDANGDGIGDFAGLEQKLDYIQELGVNTLWLLPFYPSPQRDDGYDIADYRDVHPDYGTLDDFRRFIGAAHRRGLRVITELVINHTSDQHPWFQAARRAPKGSPERDFYVWSDDETKFAGTRIIFTDTEASNWAWDPVAGQYYWHRFFSHQPDLNHNNPAVVDAVIDVMRFWLDMGVDGMRLDAIPYLCVREGTNNENLPETHAVLRRMRAVVDAHYSGRLFLAEANQWPEDVREYFGEGDECHMAYHFPLMPRMFMAVALEDRYPIAEILRQTPDIPENCQWAIFLRNHDELTLEMVTDKERDYMYRMYAHEPRMRVNVGIRRRLAPLLGNDTDRIKLMNAMLLSMPGSPILYYGDEIGQGDNIYVGDRNGVRTPMQWNVDRNAGFSRADPQRLYLPLIMDPVYGYQAVNVEAQSRDASSLLNWTRRVLAVRSQFRSFGRGTLEFVRPANRKVLAYVRTFQGESVLCVFNLAQTAQSAELDLSAWKGRVPVELMGRNSFPPIGDLPYFVTLPVHSFFWLLLSDTADPPAWHVERQPATEVPILVLPAGLATLTEERGADRTARRTVQQLCAEVLPEFLRERRWFAGKGSTIRDVQLAERALWRTPAGSWLISLIEVALADGLRQRYFLPLGLDPDDAGSGNVIRSSEWLLARIRESARSGVLVDAFADPAFCLQFVQAIESSSVIDFADGQIRFTPTRAFRDLASPGLEPVVHLGREQSNTSVILGESLFLKAYRQARVGVNPDMEMPRFLTNAGFAAIPALAGAIEYTRPDSPPITLAAVFAFARNQGDGWSYALNDLERLGAHVATEPDGVDQGTSPLFISQMRTLGRRVGEMHAVLAADTDDEAFRPEPLGADDVPRLAQTVIAEAEMTLDLLERRFGELPEGVQAGARAVLDARSDVLARVRDLSGAVRGAVRTRYHGDLHLGQVLLTADDFLITDFEGEPARPIEQRRQKGSPLRDVAGMLRSFDYARAVGAERALTRSPTAAERVDAAFRAWRDASCDAFLEGYDLGVGKARSVPSDARDRARAIELFKVEKALYELRYELDNRPAWLGVPIGGLLELLGRK